MNEVARKHLEQWTLLLSRLERELRALVDMGILNESIISMPIPEYRALGTYQMFPFKIRWDAAIKTLDFLYKRGPRSIEALHVLVGFYTAEMDNLASQGKDTKAFSRQYEDLVRTLAEELFMLVEDCVDLVFGPVPENPDAIMSMLLDYTFTGSILNKQMQEEGFIRPVKFMKPRASKWYDGVLFDNYRVRPFTRRSDKTGWYPTILDFYKEDMWYAIKLFAGVLFTAQVPSIIPNYMEANDSRLKPAWSFLHIESPRPYRRVTKIVHMSITPGDRVVYRTIRLLLAAYKFGFRAPEEAKKRAMMFRMALPSNATEQWMEMFALIISILPNNSELHLQLVTDLHDLHHNLIAELERDARSLESIDDIQEDAKDRFGLDISHDDVLAQWHHKSPHLAIANAMGLLTTSQTSVISAIKLGLPNEKYHPKGEFAWERIEQARVQLAQQMDVGQKFQKLYELANKYGLNGREAYQFAMDAMDKTPLSLGTVEGLGEVITSESELFRSLFKAELRALEMEGFSEFHNIRIGRPGATTPLWAQDVNLIKPSEELPLPEEPEEQDLPEEESNGQ